MEYNRKYYVARKKKISMKAHNPWNEEYRAYDSIRNKWNFDDLTISKLLKEYTVTEILQWEFTKTWFKPKELISIKWLLVCLALLLLSITMVYAFVNPKPILTSITSKIWK